MVRPFLIKRKRRNMLEDMEGLSPLEQMNQLLSEKEKKLDKKLQELKNYRRELRNFENQLSEKAAKVKQAQEEIRAEKEEVKKSWEALKAYETKLEVSMSEVIAEKVQMEQKSLSELDMLLEDDSWLTGEQESVNFQLDALKESVGIVPDFGTDPEEEKQTAKESKEKEKEKTNPIPKIFLEMENEIQKSYPKWAKLELLPERYCLQHKDKEIRFFDADAENPVPRVEIVVFRKNARNDRRLQANIAGIGRIAMDWNITTEENQLVCIMQFAPETNPAVVLKKCNEFMKNYFA